MNLPDSHPPKRWHIPTWLRVAVSLALLAVVVYHVDLRDSLALLSQAHLGLIALTIALMTFEAFYRSYKWLILVRCNLPGLRLWPLVRINFISAFAGQFLPGAVGMELIRMYSMARVTSNLAVAVTSVLLDRILGLIGLILVVLAGTWVSAGDHLPELRLWVWVTLALTLGGCVACGSPAVRQVLDRFLARFDRGEPLQRKLHQVYASLDNCRDRPAVLAWALLLAIGYTLLRVLVVFTAARSLDINIGFDALAVVVPLVLFATLLPISVGGIGVREGAFVTLLGFYGIAGEPALALSVLVAVLGVALELPGAWFLAVDRRSRVVPAAAPTLSTASATPSDAPPLTAERARR